MAEGKTVRVALSGRFGFLVAAIAASGCGGSHSSNPYGTNWSLAGDFSTVSNPGPVWSYGDRASGTFTALNSLGYNLGPAWGGVISVNRSGSASLGVAANAADFNAKTVSPDARWTAPYAGKYNIVVEIGGPASVTGNLGTANGQLLVNGAAQAATGTTNNVMSYSLSAVSLARGGTVDVTISQTTNATNNQVVFSISAV